METIWKRDVRTDLMACVACLCIVTFPSNWPKTRWWVATAGDCTCECFSRFEMYSGTSNVRQKQEQQANSDYKSAFQLKLVSKMLFAVLHFSSNSTNWPFLLASPISFSASARSIRKKCSILGCLSLHLALYIVSFANVITGTSCLPIFSRIGKKPRLLFECYV